MLSPSLTRAIESTLGGRVQRAEPEHGGSINDSYRVELATGATVFVKSNERAPSAMFAAEATGLAWLREANALRVPEVIAVGPAEQPFLILEDLGRGPKGRRFDERLGTGLALLHRAGAPCFGFAEDNFVGSIPQRNARSDDWAAFYRDQRLVPLLRRAADRGHLSRSAVNAFDPLLAKLDELVGPPEPAARLHGDLWSGNVHSDASGEPSLIDPAVYGGHREVDLAMMRLFGGFSDAAFHAYQATSPLAAGHGARVALYQLYPLLVHVCLFGGSYVAALDGALRKALAA